MPWTRVRGIEGLVYMPARSGAGARKRKCPDCYSCQNCGRTRCDRCELRGRCRKARARHKARRGRTGARR